MTTLTIRDVPDDVYPVLEALAARNRRSFFQQAVTLLESARALPATSPSGRAPPCVRTWRLASSGRGRRGSRAMNRRVVDTSALIRLDVPDGPVPDGLEAAVDLTALAAATRA